jgi:hypothetical protein
MSKPETTPERARVKDPLRDLVIAVAYAEHWLRDKDTFTRACIAAGLQYEPGKGLFELIKQRIPNPYEGP